MTEGPAGLPFGRYELLGLLGRGGMGEVWLAEMRGLGTFRKRVVLKRIAPELAQRQDFHVRFHAEGALAVGLNHPHIVQVFDLGEVGGESYLAMEYVDGWDLSAVLMTLQDREADAARMPTRLALRVLTALAEALGYAHRAGVVHCDVSPGNVMLDRAGAIKLLDFGVAALSGDAGHGLKVAWAAPEQLRLVTAAADARADVFALGVLAWTLLTGSHPYRGATDAATVATLGDRRQWRPPPDGPLGALLREMVAEVPAERPPHGDAAARALREAALAFGAPPGPEELAQWLQETMGGRAGARPGSSAGDDVVTPGGPPPLGAAGASFDALLAGGLVRPHVRGGDRTRTHAAGVGGPRAGDGDGSSSGSAPGSSGRSEGTPGPAGDTERVRTDRTEGAAPMERVPTGPTALPGEAEGVTARETGRPGPGLSSGSAPGSSGRRWRLTAGLVGLGVLGSFALASQEDPEVQTGRARGGLPRSAGDAPPPEAPATRGPERTISGPPERVPPGPTADGEGSPPLTPTRPAVAGSPGAAPAPEPGPDQPRPRAPRERGPTGPAATQGSEIPARAAAAVASGELRVRILPAGARVRVDGREISRAGPVLTLPLPAGPHVVEAEHDGARIERAFRVEAGAITNLRTLEVAP